MMQTEVAREQMIEQQVRAWDVLDERVLETLRKVPRERFVPAEQRFLAFADAEVPLPHGQRMLRPSVVGRLLQALALTGEERVLEVGSGTGSLTQQLVELAGAVLSVEIDPAFAAMTEGNISSFGISCSAGAASAAGGQVVHEGALIVR